MSHADESRRLWDRHRSAYVGNLEGEGWGDVDPVAEIAAALAAAERSGATKGLRYCTHCPGEVLDWHEDGRCVHCKHPTYETAMEAIQAAERAGIERCLAEAVSVKLAPRNVGEDARSGWDAYKLGARAVESRIRALLPAAVAEPAAKSLQDEIGAWGDVTFPNSTQQTIIAHLRSEVNEEIAPDCDPEELADAATLVMQLAHKRKLNLDALVRAKFEKNKRRKWAWDEKAGFSRHVKDAEPAAKCATCGGCGREKFKDPTTQETLWRRCPSCSAKERAK